MSTPLTRDEVFDSFDMHITMQQDAVDDSLKFVETDWASFKHDADYLVQLVRARSIYQAKGFVDDRRFHGAWNAVVDQAYEMRD